MNKYLIVVVVAVLALTGCNNGEQEQARLDAQAEAYQLEQAEKEAKIEAERLLLECYADSEANVEIRKSMKTLFTPQYYRETYGVNREGYITQAGRDRCKRMIERGEFTKSCNSQTNFSLGYCEDEWSGEKGVYR